MISKFVYLLQGLAGYRLIVQMRMCIVFVPASGADVWCVLFRVSCNSKSVMLHAFCV